jgi:Fic family protein
VNQSKYVVPTWGRAVSTGGSHPYIAFVPAALPREFDLGLDVVRALSAADSALGRLAGAGRLLPNPQLLLTSYRIREALASSRIEGTQASLSDVFDAEAVGTAGNDDVREVRNYVAALEHGLARLSTLPLSKRLLREMHEILLTGVRGQEKTPGEFRRTQNWIGAHSGRLESATYVPPTVDNMWPALDDWERFAHDPSPQLPVLIRTALLHYQFETIHPFLDGNGRIGRLFIVLHLIEQGTLSAPLLPISTYLEARRNDYYDRLQAVRERGDIGGWLCYFLTAIAEVARSAIGCAEELMDVRERYRKALAHHRSRAVDVIDLMLANPILTTRFVAQRLGLTQQGARNLLRQVEAVGALEPLAVGRGVVGRWVAREVLEVLDDLPSMALAPV